RVTHRCSNLEAEPAVPLDSRADIRHVNHGRHALYHCRSPLLLAQVSNKGHCAFELSDSWAMTPMAVGGEAHGDKADVIARQNCIPAVPCPDHCSGERVSSVI